MPRQARPVASIATRDVPCQEAAVTSTAGVVNAPSSTLLRAKSTSSYDDQDRAYQSKTYSVPPPADLVEPF